MTAPLPSTATQLAGAIRSSIHLRWYQADMKRRIYEAWAMGAQNVLAVGPTGMGKTVLFSDVLHDHTGSACAIAHRQELVGQIAAALNRAGVRFRLIAQPATIRTILADILKDQGISFYDPGAQVAVASVNTLVNIDKGKKAAQYAQWRAQVTLWVQDECFPGHTLVDGRRIDSLQPGDTVTAFDAEKGTFHRRPIVRVFRKDAPKHMVRLKIGHHVLESTLNHPYWTREGWVSGGLLKQGDEVLLHGASVFKMWRPIRRNEPRSALLLSKKRSALLQSSMQFGLSSRAVRSDDGRDESKICFRAYAEEKPNGKSRSTRKDGRNATSDQTRTENSRRERPATNRSRGSLGFTFGWFGVHPAIPHSDRLFNRKRGIPARLQTGSGKPDSENRDRSGRLQSLFTRTPGPGFEKGQFSYWARLDSVEIYEHRNPDSPGSSDGQSFVYNIEVEGLHTYIANGVVVHNCHHVLADNQWGRATLMFPNANCKGLGVTASPKRADGAGLGRHADGLFDVMVLGPTMRELIDDGYLTPYQIYTVPCRVDYDHLNVGASGDFAQARLAAEEDGTGLVGDIVSEYLRIAKGKRGVTFVSSVEKAHEVAEAFNAAGVPAMALSGQSDDADRARGVRMLASGELLQLVNCDLFGEGFDLPAIEVVSMGTATASLARYMQWFGRALRLMLSREVMAGYDALTSEQRRAAIAASVKPFALIIDHGGNVIRHDGPPDVPRVWTLDRYSRRSAPGETVPYRVCANPGYVLADPGGLPWADYRAAGLSNADMLAAGLLVDRGIPCAAPYERIHTLCPYCGFFPEPANRSTPEAVEGELQLLDPDMLAQLWAQLPPTMDEFRAAQTMGLPHIVAQRHRNDHATRLGELEHLKHWMMWWGGYWSQQGHTDEMAQRRFWHTFGIDVASAQALKRADAEALRLRIEAKCAIDGIVIPQYSEPN